MSIDDKLRIAKAHGDPVKYFKSHPLVDKVEILHDEIKITFKKENKS